MNILEKIEKILSEDMRSYPPNSYYAAEDDGIWYVFNSEATKTFGGSYSGKKEAEDKAKELNKDLERYGKEGSEQNTIGD